jgi:hypothetical protein
VTVSRGASKVSPAPLRVGVDPKYEGRWLMFEARDVVVLVKGNGQRFENIHANVQPTLIFISGGELPIEEDDILERKLPNGLTERYVVLDRGFWNTGNFPAHYQCKVRKESNVRKASSQTTIIYNLYGHGSRVNIESVDNSISTIETNQEQLFEKMIEVIKKEVPNNQLLLNAVAEMKEHAGKPTFLGKYQDFIQLAANAMTILGPFMPALSQLLK